MTSNQLGHYGRRLLVLAAQARQDYDWDVAALFMIEFSTVSRELGRIYYGARHAPLNCRRH